ncbi:thiamine-phosphate kinase [Crateriforma conspicua]|uniref:Thiamine-monophosphate kinase n=1 Tax=Crateriforma conspicua TaxID=2527996 RepID=A0A5C6FVZ1_9PLAN|nr:thiamine-phosphate kinase [Crateriforma conspicua]TWU65580.1 Thiamine-monophosphate kinase [Crateriforma conspicua]
METSFLAYLRGRCRTLPEVEVGIGDDAAVLAPVQGRQVICADQIIDGVDFDAAGQSLPDIGFKAMAINLSDIAAMGAVPDAAFVTLALPKGDATQTAGAVYEGILESAARHQVSIAGGDLSVYDGPLSINITMTGHVAAGEPWLRIGACEGDAIVVSGAFGGSILGRHLRPTSRLSMAAKLRRLVDVHAAIDASDGLSLDLDRMLAASRVGAELDIDQIPIHDDAHRQSEQSGRTAFEHAWSDGEDFELIMTMSADDAQKALDDPEIGKDLRRIGTVVGRTGLWKRDKGSLKRLSPQGYLHG